jgi:hypothetical protein
VRLRRLALEIDPAAAPDEIEQRDRQAAAVEALKAHQQAAASLACAAWQAKSVRLRKYARAG